MEFLDALKNNWNHIKSENTLSHDLLAQTLSKENFIFLDFQSAIIIP